MKNGSPVNIEMQRRRSLKSGRQKEEGGNIIEKGKYKEEPSPLPHDSLKDYLHNYMEARRAVHLSSEGLDSEAEKIYSCFWDYVKSRKEEKQSLTEILNDFYSEALGLKEKDRAIKSSLTRRFKKLAKKYNAGDPKYQKTLDNFEM